MLYFPGPSAPRAAPGPGQRDLFAKSAPRPLRLGPSVPRPGAPASAFSATYGGAGSGGGGGGPLAELTAPPAGGRLDPASPSHRDASATPGRGRTPPMQAAGGPSPYGMLIARQSTGQPAGASAGGGARSSGKQRGRSGVPQRAPPRRPTGGPRARFPQNFPTHAPHASAYPRGFDVVARGGGGDFEADARRGGSVGVFNMSRRQPPPPGKQQQQPSGWANGAPPAGSSFTNGWDGGGAAAYPPAAMRASAPTGMLPSWERAEAGGSGSDGNPQRSSELTAAMSELEELRGMVGGDARDQWRFEQAMRRPTTAAADGRRSGGGGMAAPPPPPGQDAGASCAGGSLARPGTAAGRAEGAGEETEAELRLRLATAESVMRKLYRKTNDLEERLAAKASAEGEASGSGAEVLTLDGAGGARPATSGGEGARPSTAALTAAAVASVGEAGGEGNDAAASQALYLLQQKESDLQQMRDYTSQLATRLEQLADDQQRSTGGGRPGTAGDTGARSDEYRERYMKMRTEYRQLLRSRTDSVKRSGRLAQGTEHSVLIDRLDQALKDEADLHRKESMRLNEAMYLKEKESCDWYVEKRLLQDRLSALEGEMSQRDELEGEIDGKMLALFTRLKQLEDDNVRLEQSNETLRKAKE